MTALLFEQRKQVAWITINRPEAKNTLNADVFVGLAEAWQEVRDNPDIRVAVLTASGGEDFCCGGDLSRIIPLWTGLRKPSNATEEKLLADPYLVDDVMLKREPLYKPVIGAVNGRALGGGCEILLATDLRIAARHAVFGVPEPKVGLVPGGGTMVRLARQISYANAMKMLLTAEPVTAEEAKSMGLISDVVDAGELLARAGEMAEKLAALAPLALQNIKQSVLESHTLGWPEAFAVERDASARVMASEDAREGPRAFKEKRRPAFAGR